MRLTRRLTWPPARRRRPGKRPLPPRHLRLTHRSSRMSSTPPSDSPSPAAPIDGRKESLIEYPSYFPIKVMGAKADGFVHAVPQTAEQFDPTFDAGTIELRNSKAGNYLGVTITVTATSREQLDDLYRALSSHPMVKV